MGVLSKGTTFVDGTQVTSTSLNNLVDSAVFTSSAVDDVTTQLSSGKIVVKTIQTGNIATNAVTTVKITDANVTEAKLATDSVSTSKIQDDAIVTAKIADSNVTTIKIADASVIPAKLSQPFTVETAKNSTSGTSIDFTSIPSWVKKITVIFDGVGTDGTSVPLLRLGDSGGFETTGYTSITAGATTTANQTRGGTSTDGFRLAVHAHSATSLITGKVDLLNVSGNTWIIGGSLILSDNLVVASTSGSKTLSDTLTQIRITTTNGTDAFDEGQINIMYQ